MAKAIVTEDLSKAYQLGNFGTGTISRDLERFWARIRGKEDPFLKIGETNARSTRGGSDIVWSLKDLNFEIEQGDAVGIIGRNGAGKSTLLKILSRVTYPTTGSVKVKGRIASLLEVGTGFHPELSGRENIYLNGAILGMRKKEIARKFDEIVDFAGVERYIDTPVKRYSSGMYVRLAFAVAAHLESEILIVDEVLAVGDAEFQKKCLGKMGDVSKGEGRTVLFVSHNMGSIASLCKKGILLERGMLVGEGNASDVIELYNNRLNQNTQHFKDIAFTGPIKDKFIFKELTINDQPLSFVPINIYPENSIEVTIRYRLTENLNFRLTFSVFKAGVRVFSMQDSEQLAMANNYDRVESRFNIPANILRPGSYQIALGGHSDQAGHEWFWNENVCSFTIIEKWSNYVDAVNDGIVNLGSNGFRL